MQSRATFVYRGQLDVERSRIEFLLAAACAAHDEVDAVMLSPGLGASADRFEAFARAQANVRRCTYIAAPSWRRHGARRALGRAIAPDASSIIGVGFSVAPYLPGRRCRVWCVNGIPEERLLHRSGLRQRLGVWVSWRDARRCRQDLTVVVSDPMARLLQERTGAATLVVPTSVDRSVFVCDQAVTPVFLTYLGGGSPWQGLDRLAAVWREVQSLEPAARFRIVTRDPRAHALADGLAPGTVEIVSSDAPRVVAGLLQEARLGFLMRAPNRVNAVSWPMKLGEYLSAGAPVVVTRCGWDAERLIERRDAGLVVDWDSDASSTALQILDYLRTLGSSRPPGVELAAEDLADDRWLVLAEAAMRRPTSPPRTVVCP